MKVVDCTNSLPVIQNFRTLKFYIHCLPTFSTEGNSNAVRFADKCSELCIYIKPTLRFLNRDCLMVTVTTKNNIHGTAQGTNIHHNESLSIPLICSQCGRHLSICPFLYSCPDSGILQCRTQPKKKMWDYASR